MRILSIIFLIGSIITYALAITTKLHWLGIMGTRPAILVGLAGLDALIAIAFGILSLNKK